MNKSFSRSATVTIPKPEYEALVAAVTSLKEQLEIQKEQIAAQSVLLKNYEEALKLAQVKQFGRSSEKFNKNAPSEKQISIADLGHIFNEVEACASATDEEDSIEYEELNYQRKKPSRNKTSKAENLEPFITEVIVHTLAGADLACPVCEHEMADLKVLDRYEVIWKPATVEAIKHKQHVYVCKHCEDEGTSTPIVIAEGFKPFLPKSSYAAETVAFLINQKYNLGLPLYRIEKDMQEQAGFFLSRQTMSNLLIKTSSTYLEDVYRLMRGKLLTTDHLHADETTVQVLREEDRKAENKSYMWLYQTGRTRKPIVVYEYQMTRAAKHPKEFLKTFKGYLQVDGYQSYEKLGKDIKLAGCWSHVRRPFADLKKMAGKHDKNSVTEKALKMIGALFTIEKKLKERYATFDEPSLLEIQKIRKTQSRPIVDEYFELMQDMYPASTGKLRQAIGYSLRQKEKLVRFLDEPRLEIDNNRAERSIKPFVIGRKNWLFSNTPNGARSSAIIYSLLITAKLNKLKPYDYLVYMFKKLQALREHNNYTPEDIEPYMPWSDSIPDHLYSKTKN